MQEAKQQLQQTINAFFKYFTDQPGKQTVHAVFGLLNFEEWVLLHYKYVTHHYRQFSLLH